MGTTSGYLVYYKDYIFYGFGDFNFFYFFPFFTCLTFCLFGAMIWVFCATYYLIAYYGGNY